MQPRKRYSMLTIQRLLWRHKYVELYFDAYKLHTLTLYWPLLPLAFYSG